MATFRVVEPNRERFLSTPCLACEHERAWHRDYQAECYQVDDCGCRAYRNPTPLTDQEEK